MRHIVVAGSLRMRLHSLLVAACLLCSSAAWADCAFPKAPDGVPDGKTATEAEMIAAMTGFKQFNTDVTEYLSCLDKETADKISSAGGATSAVVQIKSMQAKKHNAALADLKELTGKFNEQVRVFKSRKS
jgi:hypothetical protein